MKVKIHLPKGYEVKDIQVDEENGVIEIEPRFMRGTVYSTVGYLETVGDGGMAQQALLRVSSKTGRVLSVIVSDDDDELLFDKTPDEYKQAADAGQTEDPEEEVIQAPPRQTSVLGDAQ